MTPLAQRVITAAVLAPLAAAAVMVPEAPVFSVILGFVIMLAAREWTRLGRLERPAEIIIYLGVVLVGGGGSVLLAFAGGSFLLLLPVAVFWLLLVPVLAMQRGARPAKSRGRSWAVLVAGVVLLSAAWAALVSVHRGAPAGAELTLYLLVLIWGADSGAYFAGRAFGKRKLAPALSPGKTVEGAAGAILAAVLLALFYAWWRHPGTDMGLFSLLSIVVVIVSIAGDLFESLLKRREGIKDSGTLLPGHGGVLDRLDSLLAAAPVYYVGLHLLGVVR